MTEKKKTVVKKQARNSPFTDSLAQFGLTETDSRVYILLLEGGLLMGGSKIAARLSLHRQYVHTSLRKLLELSLIEEVPTGTRKRYRALPPQYLTHLAKKRLEEAESTARQLESISSVGAEQYFEIYRGTKQVFDFEERIVEELGLDEKQWIIGGGADTFITFYGDRYEDISAIAARKRLHTYYVGCPEEAEWLKRAQSVLTRFDYVILDTLPKTTVQTVIRFDGVTFYSLGNIPPLVYVLKSKSVAEDYKKFFTMLWNMAEVKK